MPGRPAGPVLALIVLVWSAGCGSPRPADQPPPFTGTLGPTALDLVTRSGTWPATQRLLDRAVNRLNQMCLARQGFSYPDLDVPAPVDPADDVAVVDLPGRATRGYGITDAGPDVTPPSRSAADVFYDGLPPAERHRFDLALFGSPHTRREVDTAGGRYSVQDTGCEADSRRRLAGDVALWARITYTPEAIGNRLAVEVEQAPAYRDALTAWRSCMRDQGHPYPTPEQAQQDLRADTGTPADRRRSVEIAVASADGNCAIRTRLPSTALNARRELAAHLPHADRATVAELAFHRDAAVERARAFVPSAP
ncbi:hypothetical protein [Saccharothrix obliqua]|uniref:hypothetical protein n=1 Tax=Saccharothrix obliqua TaxID=2861747 RepID=UPI001C5F32CE|nr:hypothetical protein [Saccharothrix obliqua]MBW4722163.1 hypothetical protein [Saccharothrix obliqua]